MELRGNIAVARLGSHPRVAASWVGVMPQTCKSTFVGSPHGNSLTALSKPCARRKSATVQGLAASARKSGMTTLVDSTSHVLPQNPHGGTLHKENRGS